MTPTSSPIFAPHRLHNAFLSDLRQRWRQTQRQRQRQSQRQTQRQFISYLRTPNCPFLFYKQQKLVSLSCVFNLFETKSLPFPQSKYPQPSFSTIKYMVLIFPIYKEPPPTAFLCLKGWLVTTFSCWIIGPSLMKELKNKYFGLHSSSYENVENPPKWPNLAKNWKK